MVANVRWWCGWYSLLASSKSMPPPLVTFDNNGWLWTALFSFCLPVPAGQLLCVPQVLRGPAPLPLALSHVEETGGKVFFEKWWVDVYRVLHRSAVRERFVFLLVQHLVATEVDHMSWTSTGNRRYCGERSGRIYSDGNNSNRNNTPGVGTSSG